MTILLTILGYIGCYLFIGICCELVLLGCFMLLAGIKHPGEAKEELNYNPAISTRYNIVLWPIVTPVVMLVIIYFLIRKTLNHGN